MQAARPRCARMIMDRSEKNALSAEGCHLGAHSIVPSARFKKLRSHLLGPWVCRDEGVVGVDDLEGFQAINPSSCNGYDAIMVSLE